MGPNRKQNGTVLYVDDDHDDQLIFQEALNEVRPEMKCELISDGIKALKFLKEAPLPLCIYLDVNMPIMNGLQVLEKIKQDARLSHIPTFILTTSKSPMTEKKAKGLGATYLIKPNSYSEYLHLLDKCLKAHQY